MTIKLGINGFDRIGRNVLRATVQNFHDIKIVGNNDLLEPDYLKYMLQYDSIQSRFMGDVSVNDKTYAGQAIISNASCTTNCLAPVAMVLNDKWGHSNKCLEMVRVVGKAA